MSTVRLLPCRLLAAACALLLPVLAAAQPGFPERPVKLIVPFSAGGATDVLARIVGAGMSAKLGQPFVIDNRPGASTIVGATALMKSPPDGYTLMVSSGTTLALNPALRSNLPYDPVQSFSHLGPMASMDLVVVVNEASPARTLKDLVDRARSKPGEVSFATFGVGSSVHFGAEMLLSAANIRMVHVPFNGSSQSLAALMGNQVNSAVDSAVASAPFIKAGKIKPLAVLSPHRSALLPDVPTAVESGYPDVLLGSWFALIGPAGMPEPVRRKLETTLAQVLREPAIRKQLLDVGLTAEPGSGASVVTHIERELPLMRAVAARANVRAD